VHVILNHIPVMVVPVGMAVLALGLWRRNSEFAKVGLGIVATAAIMALPTYLTGEPAADVVGSFPRVMSDAIEEHEDVATQALVVVCLAGIGGLAALILGWRKGQAPRWLVLTTLALSFVASVWLGVTANLGGQIRHAEIRAPTAATEP
jgi:hypothetical protein